MTARATYWFTFIIVAAILSCLSKATPANIQIERAVVVDHFFDEIQQQAQDRKTNTKCEWELGLMYLNSQHFKKKQKKWGIIGRAKFEDCNQKMVIIT